MKRQSTFPTDALLVFDSALVCLEIPRFRPLVHRIRIVLRWSCVIQKLCRTILLEKLIVFQVARKLVKLPHFKNPEGSLPYSQKPDFFLVINQLNAQIFFYNKFISSLYMFRAPCAHHQEVKIVLYSIWYHHTCWWPSGTPVEIRVVSQPVQGTATYRCDDTSCCVIQFWPPDDEHIVLETCRGI